MIAPRHKEKKRMGSKWWHWIILVIIFGLFILFIDGNFNRIILMVIGGFLAIVFATMVFFVGIYKLIKSEKASGDSLNKKTKK